MEKILITGTGRCGTTFLIKLFSFLDFNTGFNRDNFNSFIFKNCNAGMEKKYTEKYYILKNPRFMAKIEEIVKDKTINIKYIIMPIRNIKESAISRVKNKNKPGGLWCAKDELSQINFYNQTLTNYLYISTKYDIKTIFIDFEKMINNKLYLFNKLKIILDEKNIDLKKFNLVYDEVSITSKPKK